MKTRTVYQSIAALMMSASLMLGQAEMSARQDLTILLGGSGIDRVNDMAVDAEGNVYVAGYTRSANFPTQPAASPRGGDDAVVVKWNASTRQVVYAVTLAGSGDEAAEAIAVDAAGNVYVTGATSSADFPTRNAYQGSRQGPTDAFVTKLDANGNIVYSTYLGGGTPQACGCSAREQAYDIAVDNQGRAYVVGHTYALDFPTTVTRANVPDWGEAYLTVLRAQGNGLVFSATYGGTPAYDVAFGLALRPDGSVYVVGSTNSGTFPTSADAYQRTNRGGQSFGDAYVALIDPSRPDWLVRSTLYGGAGPEIGRKIVVDGAGVVWIMGRTMSMNLPVTAGALQGSYRGGAELGDGYIAKFNATLTQLDRATYFGGFSDEYPLGMVMDGSGRLLVAGYSASQNLPVSANALQGPQGDHDGFLLVLKGSDLSLQYLSMFGTTATDYVKAIALGSNGAVWLGGESRATRLPGMTNGTSAGDYDLFVTRWVLSGGPATEPRIVSMVNAASYEGGRIAPGQIVTLFGEAIGPQELRTGSVGTDGVLARAVAGYQVWFGGIAAPVIYASAGQTAVIVPYGLSGRTSVAVQVVHEAAGRSAEVNVPVVSAAPALFTADSSGRGPGAILNQDGTLNRAGNAAARGAVVVLYGTGEGRTAPGGVDGKVATGGVNDLPRPVLPVAVTIGGLPAEILYAGAAPMAVAGQFQINIRIPMGLMPGAHDVRVQVGDVWSPAGVTVEVR